MAGEVLGQTFGEAGDKVAHDDQDEVALGHGLDLLPFEAESGGCVEDGQQ